MHPAPDSWLRAPLCSPILVFDSLEKWFPVSVEKSLALAGYMWTEGGWRKTSARASAVRLDFPADMRQPDLPPVGYHRVVKGGGLHWHQFWLWYLYNPWSVAGVGRHEGDWELVQVGCADADGARPVLVTGSQHHGGGKREFWSCDRLSGRPVIFVALGSHANYFAPGQQGGGLDRCDADGVTLSVEWRPFGEWADWPGRWGNSTGEGKSPESPGRQGHRWTAPHLYHSASR